MRQIQRQEVERLVSAGAQLVDVMPKEEFEEAHLPGAIHIPLARIAADAGDRLDADRPVVVYCYDSL